MSYIIEHVAELLAIFELVRFAHNDRVHSVKINTTITNNDKNQTNHLPTVILTLIYVGAGVRPLAAEERPPHSFPFFGV